MENLYSFLIIDTFRDNDESIHGFGYSEDKIPFTNKEAAKFILDEYNKARKEIPFAASGFVVLIFSEDIITYRPCRVFRLRSTLKFYLRQEDEIPSL